MQNVGTWKPVEPAVSVASGVPDAPAAPAGGPRVSLHLRVLLWGQRGRGSVGEKAVSRVLCVTKRQPCGRFSCCLRGPSWLPEGASWIWGETPRAGSCLCCPGTGLPLIWVLKVLVQDRAQGCPSQPRTMLRVQGLESAPTVMRAKQVGFFCAQWSPWTMAVLRCWWEVNGLDSQGSVFLGLWEPVTLVCKYVATSEAPSRFVKMELSAGLAQGWCGALLGPREARTSLLSLPPLVCFVTDSAPLPFVVFTTLPVNLLVLDASCEQSHTACALSCLAPSAACSQGHPLGGTSVLFLADYFLI